MSKSVRIKDYLYAELERIAAREDRSLANLVNKLLEQAIAMEERKEKMPVVTTAAPAVSADAQPRDIPARTIKPSGAADVAASSADSRAQASVEPRAAPEDHFKPDPKRR